jgi:hypothetical protein
MRPRETCRRVVTSPAEWRPGDGPGRGRVVRLRPRLRVASRPGGRPPALQRVAGQNVLIRLDERRGIPARRPVSPDGVWLIVTVTAMLVSMFVWRFLR